MVVDRLFKYSHFLAFSHPYSAKDVAHLFITKVVCLHGFPKSIVSDRDKVVMSRFWTETFVVAGTKLKYSKTFHPHMDGQIEVINKCLKKYLWCFAGGCPKRWLDWLSWAKYWFNTSFSASTRTTPFQPLYGVDHPVLFKGETYPSSSEEVAAITATRDVILVELRDNMLRAQQNMKRFANKK